MSINRATVTPAPDAATSDGDLIARATANDETAFRAIMQRYNTGLYRLARGILGNDGDAEDAVQESYMRAFSRLDSFRGESSLGTWLGRITINEALDRRRRQPGPADWAAFETDKIVPFPHQADTNPERAMAQQEIRRLVETAIDRLPPDFRLVLIARVIENMSVEDTAAMLDLSVENVKTRLHRARALLREQMEKQIGPLAFDAFPFAGERCTRLTESVLIRLKLTH